MSKKLNLTEDVLKEMAEKMALLNQDKETVLLELEKTREELDRTRASCATVEEKKAEAELSLKTEIKFLISKLTKTKTKLAQNVQKTCNSACIENALRQLRSVSSANQGYIASPAELSGKKQRKSENRYTEEEYCPRQAAEVHCTQKQSEGRTIREDRVLAVAEPEQLPRRMSVRRPYTTGKDSSSSNSRHYVS